MVERLSASRSGRAARRCGGSTLQYFAASVDTPETNASLRRRSGLDYPILSDPTRDVARAYGVLVAERVRVAVDVLHRGDGRILDDRQEGAAPRRTAPTSSRRLNEFGNFPDIAVPSQADRALTRVRLERRMALLDRFRTQTRQKHPDPAVRLAFVQEIPLDERDLLAEIAREDADARVRRAAVAKLMDPAALAGVARDDADEARARAGDRRCCATSRSRRSRASAKRRASRRSTRSTTLPDARTLVGIAKSAPREAMALRALARRHRRARARIDRASRRARVGRGARVRRAAGSTARSSASR